MRSVFNPLDMCFMSLRAPFSLFRDLHQLLPSWAAAPGAGEPPRPLQRRSARPHRLLLGTALLGLALTGCGGGQDPDPAPPASSWSASKAATELVQGSPAHPGALAVRVTPDAVDVQVRGLRRSQAGAPAVQAEDRFAAGSLTKSMTATLAAVLVQKRHLAWDSRLLDVLPELAPAAQPAYANVTLRDLLAHRSGLFAGDSEGDLAQLPALGGTPAQQRLQLVAWALARKPTIPPGAGTEYSNGGYVAAAAMLERVAGRPYEQLLNQEVFAPLGAEVAFGAPGATGGPWGHSSRDGRSWTPWDPQDERVGAPEFANPAGGALVRGSDLGRFLQLHLRALRGTGGLLLSPESARELNRVVAADVALGWSAGKDLQGQPLSWHNGSDDVSYSALMAVSSVKGVATAALVNGLAPQTEAAISRAVVQMIP